MLLAVDPDKDVDGLHPVNLGRLVMGANGPLPCTPAGIVELLAANDVPVEGKHAVVIGRGLTIGRPLALLLAMKRPGCNAAVTVVHTGVEDMAGLVRQGDVVVAAAGRAGLVTPDMVKPGAAVVGAGTSWEGRKLLSDVDAAVADVAGWITPRLGGVGPDDPGHAPAQRGAGGGAGLVSTWPGPDWFIVPGDRTGHRGLRPGRPVTGAGRPAGPIAGGFCRRRRGDRHRRGPLPGGGGRPRGATAVSQSGPTTTTTLAPTTTTAPPVTTTTEPATTTTEPPPTTSSTHPAHTSTTTVPTTTTTSPASKSTSSKTPWGLIALIVVLVAAIVLVVVLLRSRKKKSVEAGWHRAVVPALSDAQLARDAVLSDNAMSGDPGLRGAVDVQVDKAATALERVARTAPDPDASALATEAAAALRGWPSPSKPIGCSARGCRLRPGSSWPRPTKPAVPVTRS